MKNNTMMKRLVITKGGGFLFGLLGVVLFKTALEIEVDIYLGLGLIVWGTMIGALTGIFGTMTKHPYFGFRLRPFLRGAISGLSITLLVILVAWPVLLTVFTFVPGVSSPWWMLIDGMVIGAILDILGTKYAGEGKNLL